MYTEKVEYPYLWTEKPPCLKRGTRLINKRWGFDDSIAEIATAVDWVTGKPIATTMYKTFGGNWSTKDALLAKYFVVE